MSVAAYFLKTSLSPERYYSAHLNGSFGKATGQCWHKWNGLCPFHNDTRAGSFVVNITTGAYRCFSCGEHGGDIIAFHMKSNCMSFTDALTQLQEIVRCAR